MSDKDSIRRGDAEEARDELVRVLNYINTSGTLDYADYCELFDAIERVFDALKAVPHEMSARELFSTRDRMCNSNYNGGHITPACKTCPLWRDNNGYDMYCGSLMASHPMAFITIVERWAREHGGRAELAGQEGAKNEEAPSD